MLNACHEFYSSLYAAPDQGDADSMLLDSIMNLVPRKVTAEMNERLCEPISLEELEGAMKALANEKAPGPDGVTIEFFKTYWELVGLDYLSMIQLSLREGKLPASVVQGLISLLHKGGDRRPIGNYRPITLLNSTYKIYAKLLQCRLQPILMKVISPDQSAFLPLRYILDNIVLTQENLNWAKTSKQPLILLKLDYIKAYDIISWVFLFRAMEELGFDRAFVEMTQLLVSGASAEVCLNGSPSKRFQILRGMHQGCPLAPYLFLIAGEVLNIQMQKAASAGQIKGIKIPTIPNYQLISQYADDTTLFIRGEERFTQNTVRILEQFCQISGLEINWAKSAAFWQHRGHPVPPWTSQFSWAWAHPQELGKLLGTPFELDLSS
jgi:hypothetical protein